MMLMNLWQVVVNVDVYLPTGRHRLHTDISVAIFVGVSAHMLMLMVIVFHCHFKRKTWRTTARGFTRRKHSWNCELRKKHNQ
jgi:hypothetical protein